MTSSPLLMIALALLICSAGVFVLWHAWSEKKAVALWLGLGLTIVAIPVWSLAVGWEFALVYNSIAVALFAWLCCLLQLEYKTKRLPNATRDKRLIFSKKTKIRWWWLLLSLVAVAGPVSALLSVVVCRWLPMTSGNQMAAATLVFPFSWALISLWLCYSQHFIRNNVILVVLGGLSALVIFG